MKTRIKVITHTDGTKEHYAQAKCNIESIRSIGKKYYFHMLLPKIFWWRWNNITWKDMSVEHCKIIIDLFLSDYNSRLEYKKRVTTFIKYP